MGLRRFTLLTGSTGQVGQFLLVDLLRSQIPVAVLTRSDRTRSAQTRINDLLTRFESLTSRQLPRPVVLEANLASSGLGLTLNDRKWIEANCGSVIHSAASLSFKPADQHPDNEPFLTNVNGTQQLVDLCRNAGIREFHDISTAYVCGLRSGRIMEAEGEHGQQFSNDYEKSKLQSEAIVHSAGFDSLTVYRPSIVVDLDEGAQQLGERTIYYAFSVFQLLTQKFGNLDHDVLFQSVGLTGRERKNIVPSSWVARTIIEIFRRPSLHGQTYHLTNPQGTSIAELFHAFQEVLRPINSHPLATKSDVVEKPKSGWGEIAGVIENFVETFTPYFRDDPQFDQTNLLRALDVCQLPNCPNIDSRALQTITRQQMSNKATFSPKSSKSKNAPQQPSCRWSQLLKSVAKRGPLKQTPDFDTHLHLTLTGAGGGRWLIQFNRDQKKSQAVEQSFSVQPASSNADEATEVYASATCWSGLLAKEGDLKFALRSGSLLIEGNPSDAAEEDLADLIKLLRRYSLALHHQAPRHPEVTAHGK